MAQLLQRREFFITLEQRMHEDRGLPFMFAELYRDHHLIAVCHLFCVDSVDFNQAGLEVIGVFTLAVGFIGGREQGARHGAFGGAPVIGGLNVPDRS